jgi:hypothetical protein
LELLSSFSKLYEDPLAVLGKKNTNTIKCTET